MSDDALRFQATRCIIDCFNDIGKEQTCEVPMASENNIPGLNAGRQAIMVGNTIKYELAIVVVPMLMKWLGRRVWSPQAFPA